MLPRSHGGTPGILPCIYFQKSALKHQNISRIMLLMLTGILCRSRESCFVVEALQSGSW